MSVQLPIQTIETTDTHWSYRHRVAAGVALIVIGLLIAAGQVFQINMEGWAFFAVPAAIFLAWGLVTFSAPAPLQVADVEALPIDIVPIEELTKAVQGDRKAALSDKPAPTPTQRPVEAPPAPPTGSAPRAPPARGPTGRSRPRSAG